MLTSLKSALILLLPKGLSTSTRGISLQTFLSFLETPLPLQQHLIILYFVPNKLLQRYTLEIYDYNRIFRVCFCLEIQLRETQGQLLPRQPVVCLILNLTDLIVFISLKFNSISWILQSSCSIGRRLNIFLLDIFALIKLFFFR